MAVRELRASGLECLALATQLLQRARLKDPETGLWEAADLQWWWRTPRRSDKVDQLFWIEDGEPVAAVVLTKWSRGWGCDPIVVPGAPVSLDTVWARALDAIAALRLEAVETLVRDDDAELIGLLADSGFVPDSAEPSGVTWMDAEGRPDVAPPPEGFVVVDREGKPTTPHPMKSRSGEAVEARLRQCSLYDPGLDLAVEAPGGEAAGYSLYWFDPVTKVGLLEPMRVEDAFQRQGLASAMLGAGLERLAARGARRLKVGYGSEIGRRLYVGAGFSLGATSTTYRREVAS